MSAPAGCLSLRRSDTPLQNGQVPERAKMRRTPTRQRDSHNACQARIPRSGSSWDQVAGSFAWAAASHSARKYRKRQDLQLFYHNVNKCIDFGPRPLL
jgi:hypothetical protein